MTILTRMTGTSLVAVLHANDSAFALSEHDRAQPRCFTFVPRRIDATNVMRMLLDAMAGDADKLRSVHVVEGGAADHFTNCAKLALVALAGACGASLWSIPFLKARIVADRADCTTAGQVAIALELERRRRKANGERLGELVLASDMKTEMRDLRQHIQASA